MTAPKQQASAGANWLTHHHQVVTRALKSIGATPGTIGDRIVAEPQLLASLMAHLAQLAQQEGAPTEVITDLHTAQQNLQAGIPHLQQPENAYIRTTLAQLKGTSSAKAVETALDEAANTAPDERSRRKLEAMRTVVRAGAEPPDDVASLFSWGACAFCGLLGMGVAGPLGGAVACGVCGFLGG